MLGKTGRMLSCSFAESSLDAWTIETRSMTTLSTLHVDTVVCLGRYCHTGVSSKATVGIGELP